MPVPQRTALTLPDPRGVQPTIDMAKWGEAEGYDDLWFADSSGVDALTTAAAVALSTERVRIGTAIIPVFSRTPAVLASTAHVLHQLSNGRFILGLGSSSQTMMENWHGLTFEKPLNPLTPLTAHPPDRSAADKMHGEGTYTFENGTVQKGRWEHGNAVKTQ